MAYQEGPMKSSAVWFRFHIFLHHRLGILSEIYQSFSNTCQLTPDRDERVQVVLAARQRPSLAITGSRQCSP
jgi:hypothetical protein